MRRLLFWLLFAATMAVYATMLVWTLPTVSAAAGDLPPFDMRPGGYDLEAARAFVAALSPEGKSFYLDVQQRLDLFYPLLIALTVYFAVAALLPLRLGRWRYLIAAPALAIALFDYLENAAVAKMLSTPPAELSAGLVDEASRWTVLKSGTSSVMLTLPLLLIAWKLIQWWSRRRTRAGQRVEANASHRG